MKSIIDAFSEIRNFFNTLNAEPTLMKCLNETLEPIDVKSNTLNELPSLDIPYTETALPSLWNTRMLIVDPKLT
jgi:hypothetical protein